MRAITAKEAVKLAKILGIDLSGNGRTFYATDSTNSEIWEFDTKQERDNFTTRNKEQ